MSGSKFIFSFCAFDTTQIESKNSNVNTLIIFRNQKETIKLCVLNISKFLLSHGNNQFLVKLFCVNYLWSMILFRYILKAHFIPFVFSLITLMCIFLLQFLMKFADRLVGKGLDGWVITKLIAYNLSWMVVLVVPMASLVATLMAFGNLSQNNEVTIMKSSGISLYKMMFLLLLQALL